MLAVRNAVAVKSCTTAVGRSSMCPRLPTPPSTEPAYPDQPQLSFNLPLSQSVCSPPKLIPPVHKHISVPVLPIYPLQQPFVPFATRPINQLSLSQVCKQFTELYTSSLYIKYIQTFTQPYIRYLFVNLASRSTDFNFDQQGTVCQLLQYSLSVIAVQSVSYCSTVCQLLQ
jgi:hypothetical protein